MDTARVLAVASAAARAAGALIRAHSGRAAIAGTKADAADLVTQTDRDCQAVILAEVRGAFGEAHRFLGEEDVPAGPVAAAAAIASSLALGGVLWVVDPIDGTQNFVHGLPLSCVSIGVAEEGVVAVAVVYDPHRDELFSAVRGGGAHCNGAPMRVAQCGAMREAMFGWGLHHARHVGKTMLRACDTLMDRCRGVRALGSAALMMAYVAAGRFAGFFEHELCAWDLAAGSLLVTEAGGVCTDMRGGAYSLLVRDGLATCSAAMHSETLALLAEAKAQHADSAEAWPPLD